MIKIKENILKAAILYKAKNDIRYYLNDLYIDNNIIVATNGHICFKAPIESDEQRIIKFLGKLPSSFEYCTINGDVAEFVDKNLNIIAQIGVQTIYARYPDYNRLYNDKIGNIQEIGMRGDYLQLIGKTAKLLTNDMSCKFTFQSTIDGIKVKIGEADVLLMPTRI